MRRLVFLLLAGLLSAGVTARAADPAPSDDEKEGTIAGTAIKRTGEGWLGLEIKDDNFVLTFYNAKKKPVAADKTSAVMRWAVHYQPNDERTELTAGDTPSVLTSTYTVKAPHAFKLHISLLPAADDGSTESYIIDFSG